jgi:hypothetical protein
MMTMSLFGSWLHQEEIWVMGTDYSAAVADPLRECAPRIVEDMNRKHWEDIRRFCNVYTRLDAEVSCLSPTGQILSLSQ